ncbi:MAG: DUF373 family protein [Thermoplasmatota archaeon]
MKVLILCVDRDDDLGAKAGVKTPLVGRRRNLDAAVKLGLADPEDSDTNALLAAVRLHDQELEAKQGADDQVEVATLAGHQLVGLRSDRKIARELDEVLEMVRPDEVILVSDGAEDESILPILTSRCRVSHVHRNIVKQAPRIEGFIYLLSRMLDDQKMAKRFILPLALVFLVWGFAFLTGYEIYALAATLGIIGGWLLVHAMHWEDRVTNFNQEMVQGLRGGTIMVAANVVMLLLFAVGGVSAYGEAIGDTSTVRALLFLKTFLPYFVSALLVRQGGQLFDDFIQRGSASLRTWTAAFSLIAFGFIGSVAVDLALAMSEGERWTALLSFDLVLRLLVGLSVAMGGLLVARYVRQFFDEPPTPGS